MRRYLGSEWIRLERITDNSNRLSLRETRHLEGVLDDFERSFPQVFHAVYLGALPNELTVSDFGFWLINHGAFHTPMAVKRNDFGVVLVIDPLRQSAGLTVGYALERILPEAVLGRVLGRLRPALAKSNAAAAIERSVHYLRRELRTQATAMPREMPEMAPPSGDLAVLGLETLRRAHRPLPHERSHP
jgi:uncharacterized membrane protein YgcG